MGDGEKGNASQFDAFDPRLGVEREVEHEMPGFVSRQPERRTGKEFHDVCRAMGRRLRFG